MPYKIRFPHLSPKPIDTRVARMPDFAYGSCTTELGKKIARAAMTDEASHRAIKARNGAKSICSACPILDACRRWALTQEDPPGSWGGVWGGLDPWNRRGWELIIRDGKAELIPYGIDKH